MCKISVCTELRPLAAMGIKKQNGRYHICEESTRQIKNNSLTAHIKVTSPSYGNKTKSYKINHTCMHNKRCKHRIFSHFIFSIYLCFSLCILLIIDNAEFITFNAISFLLNNRTPKYDTENTIVPSINA